MYVTTSGTHPAARMAPKASAALRHAASQSGAGAAEAEAEAEAEEGASGAAASGAAAAPASSPPPSPSGMGGDDSDRCSEGAGDIGGLPEPAAAELELEGHGAPHALISELKVTVFGLTPAARISANSSSASLHLPARSHAEISEEKVITDRSQPLQTISL